MKKPAQKPSDTRIDNQLLGRGGILTIHAASLRVFLALAKIASWQTGQAFPGRILLMEMTGLSAASVSRAMGDLMKRQLISLEAREVPGKATAVYRVNNMPRPQTIEGKNIQMILPLWRITSPSDPKNRDPSASPMKRQRLTHETNSASPMRRITSIAEQATATRAPDPLEAMAAVDDAAAAFLLALGVDLGWVVENSNRWPIDRIKQARDYAMSKKPENFVGYLIRSLERGYGEDAGKRQKPKGPRPAMALQPAGPAGERLLAPQTPPQQIEPNCAEVKAHQDWVKGLKLTLAKGGQ